MASSDTPVWKPFLSETSSVCQAIVGIKNHSPPTHPLVSRPAASPVRLPFRPRLFLGRKTIGRPPRRWGIASGASRTTQTWRGRCWPARRPSETSGDRQLQRRRKSEVVLSGLIFASELLRNIRKKVSCFVYYLCAQHSSICCFCASAPVRTMVATIYRRLVSRNTPPPPPKVSVRKNVFCQLRIDLLCGVRFLGNFEAQERLYVNRSTVRGFPTWKVLPTRKGLNHPQSPKESPGALQNPREMLQIKGRRSPPKWDFPVLNTH